MCNGHTNDQTSWFPKEMLQEAIQFAEEEEGLFDDLNKLYNSIPTGKCSGCAGCCMESVETHWVEFLQIFDYLSQRPEILQELSSAIRRYYLLEGVEKKPCPFQLEDKRCAIYSVRPFPCRFFGHWSKDAYESNLEVTIKSNKEIADFYKTNYNLTLPDYVINYKVPFCESFEHPDDFNEEDFYDILEKVMEIQSKFLVADLIDEDMMTLGLISWLMGVWFDLDTLHEKKVEIMGDFLEGKEEKLNFLLKKWGKENV